MDNGRNFGTLESIEQNLFHDSRFSKIGIFLQKKKEYFFFNHAVKELHEMETNFFLFKGWQRRTAHSRTRRQEIRAHRCSILGKWMCSGRVSWCLHKSHSIHRLDGLPLARGMLLRTKLGSELRKAIDFSLYYINYPCKERTAQE